MKADKGLKKVTAVLTVLMLLASISIPAFAAEDTVSAGALSEEATSFLEEHGVDLSIFETAALAEAAGETAAANSYDESVLALKNAAAAYHFTDEQIQAYMEGLVSTPTQVVAAEDTASAGALSEEASSFLEEHGVDLSIFETAPLAELDAETAAANSYDESVLALKDAAAAYHFTDEQIQAYVEGLVSTPTEVVYSRNEPSLCAKDRPDDDGLGYEVQAIPGYYQETAFAILPSVYRAASSAGGYSDGYMFYTVSNGQDWGIDVGLAYNSGKGVEGWRGCYTVQGSNTESEQNVQSSLHAGSLVYLDAVVTTNGYVRIRVLDGNNFNTVYYDVSYYVAGEGITRTNAVFNRQITLCNANKNFNTGAYLRNGQFYDAYVYSATGYSQTVAGNTVSNRRGAFGTNSTNAKQVTVNSYTPWYAENVTINF